MMGELSNICGKGEEKSRLPTIWSPGTMWETGRRSPPDGKLDKGRNPGRCDDPSHTFGQEGASGCDMSHTKASPADGNEGWLQPFGLYIEDMMSLEMRS